MSAADSVLSALNRARGRPLTVSELAERTGTAVPTVRRVLSALSEEGVVSGVDVRYTGQRGRPARTFALS